MALESWLYHDLGFVTRIICSVTIVELSGDSYDDKYLNSDNHKLCIHIYIKHVLIN